MKKVVGIVVMCYCILSFACSSCRAESSSYEGDLHPFFYVQSNEKLYCTRYIHYDSIFTNQLALYSIDLNDLSVREVFRTRDANSSIVVDDDGFIYTYNKSIIPTFLVRGDYNWYYISNKCSASSIFGRGKKLSDRNTTFVQGVCGIMYYSKESDQSNHYEIGRYSDGEFESLIEVDIDDYRSITWGASYIILNDQTKKTEGIYKIFDIVNARLLCFPCHMSGNYLPKIVISGDQVFYKEEQEVFRYDILDNRVSQLYNSSDARYMVLCYSNGFLYVIEECKNNVYLNELFRESGQITKRITLPDEFRFHYDYIVVNDLVFCGDISSEYVTVYNMTTESTKRIQLK